MALSKEEAQEHGALFSVEGHKHPADPDIEVFSADLTLNGHTLSIHGKSEEDVLAQIEQALINAGLLKREDSGAVEQFPREPNVALDTDSQPDEGEHEGGHGEEDPS